MFAIELSNGRHEVWVPEEFVSDNHWTESKLFALLDSLKVSDRLRASNSKERLLLSSEGVIPLPP
jgi:hypothetical protein